MAVPKKVINYLKKKKAKYQLIEHRTVYTAFDKSATLKVSPKIIGKTLAVKVGKKAALVLIPANKNLDIQKLKKTCLSLFCSKGQKSKKKPKEVKLVKEAWIKNNLKGIKVGAIVPFGNLWGLSTLVDKSLMRESKIIISAGDYRFSIKIAPNTLKKLIPDLVVGVFSKARK